MLKSSRLLLIVGLCVELCSLMFLNGCTSLRSDVNKDIAYNKKVAERLQTKASSADQYRQIEITDKIWLGPFHWGDKTSTRPPQLVHIWQYTSKNMMPLTEAIHQLSKDSGVQISLNKSARIYLGITKIADSKSSNPISNQPNQVNPSYNPSYGANGIDPMSNDIPIKQENKQENEGSTDEKVDLNYFLYGKKSLSGWLDAIALRYGLFWSYTYVDNKPYVTFSATTDADIQFDGLLAQNSSSLTTSSTDSSNGKQSLTAWEEIKNYATKILTKVGAVSFSTETGRIYISDRPEVVDKLRKRVAYENAVFSKEIHYDIKVLTVNLNEAQSYQGGIKGIYKDLASALNIDSGVSLGSGVNVTYAKTGASKAAGSSIQETLSSSLANRVTIQDRGFFARNRSKVQQHYKDVDSYVKTVTTNATDNGTTTVSPTISNLQEGIEFQFKSSVLTGNRIAIDLSLSQTYEKSRIQKDYGGNTITLPKVNDTSILDQFTVKSGQTFILSDSTLDQSSNESGPLKTLGLWQLLFGGHTDSNKANSARFFIITPTIISDGNSF